MLWPVSSDPIQRGALLVDATGRIAAVGPEAAVAQPAGTPTIDYPDAVVLPGLVNAHTHLELHAVGGHPPDPDFVRWLRGMRRVRETTEEQTYRDGARAGLRETWRHGTTTVADTGTSGATVRAWSALGGRGIYYQEVIGPEPQRSDGVAEELRRTVAALRRTAPADVVIGVSPHAPYTVHPELLARVVPWARSERLPLAMHVAESRAEVQFLTAGHGGLADHWRARGIAVPAPVRSPVAWAEAHGLLARDLLAIHAVELDDLDIARLAEAGAAVAVCLCSNRRHGHGVAPLEAMLAAGVRVGLGTDSVASVESLDLVAEAQAACRVGGIGAADAVRLLTLGGARALGLERRIGSLELGKWADLCIVQAGRASSAPAQELAERLLQAGSAAIVSTYLGGREVYRR